MIKNANEVAHHFNWRQKNVSVAVDCIMFCVFFCTRNLSEDAISELVYFAW